MNKSFIWKFLIFIGVLSLTLSWTRLSLAAAFGDVNVTSTGDEKPARVTTAWNNNILNFNARGDEFYINVVNSCNNNDSCTCDNIQETVVPGEGKGPDYSGKDLRGKDWSNKKLGNIRLKGIRLDGVNLMNSDLGFAFLTQSLLDKSLLINANLAGANLQGASLKGADLKDVTLFDGELSSAYPVSFTRTWKSVTIDTSPLPDGTYIDQLNVEMCSGGETRVTLLLLEGNGANVKDADFSSAKNLSSDNIEYICRWGGEKTRRTLGTKCDQIAQQQKNPYEVMITDSFEVIPQVVDLTMGQSAKSYSPGVVIKFSDPIMLEHDAIELHDSNSRSSVKMELKDKDDKLQLYSFFPTNPLELGMSYQIVLLSGKALDRALNLLKGDRILGSLRIFSSANLTNGISEIEATLQTHMLAGKEAFEQGRNAEAEKEFAAAIDKAEKFGPINLQISGSLNNLGEFYINQGRYIEAEPLLKRALEVEALYLSKDLSKIITIFNNLVRLYTLQKRDKEVTSLTQHLPEMIENAMGTKYSELTKKLSELGMMFYNQGQYKEAELFLEKSVAIQKEVFGSNHPGLAIDIFHLAFIYYTQGKYDEAEPLYQKSIALQKELFGEEHPNVALILNNLAKLYYKQNKYDQALQLYQQSLEILEKCLSPNYLLTSHILNNIALVYYDQGKYNEAEESYKRAYQMKQNIIKSEQLKSAEILEDYATLLRKIGRETEALEMESRAKTIRNGGNNNNSKNK